ncbi:hypothetical protein G4B88_001836 [Cannabis sativa]|uniref:Uncharacterized protein n=1 Tax=Cannabis sativa TaxID=3483 RepID=A0A7J6I247_CANSA|nr:hypothetical protein G4B88_001836 [Cannabis sativa]
MNLFEDISDKIDKVAMEYANSDLLVSDHLVQQTPTMSNVENQPPLYSNLVGEGARRSKNETTVQQLA